MTIELPGRAVVSRRLQEALERAGDGLATTVTVVGEIGMGRTTLLADLRRRAADDDRTVLGATGRIGDAEIGFSSLVGLLRPVEDRIDDLAGDAAEGLRSALALSPEASDPTRVRLGLFRLLTGLAAERPTLLTLDDAHLIDGSTWDALRFAIGRLDADQITTVISIDPTSTLVDEVHGEVLLLEPLDEHDMNLLLDATADLAPEVRARCNHLSSGNPLVALELVRSLDDGQRRGHTPLPTMPEPPAALARGFEAALATVPSELWPALVVVAADATGDVSVLQKVLSELGQSDTTLDELERTGFIEIADRTVHFGHPLLRQFVLYRSSSRSRRSAHRALARVLDQDHQLPTRAWHLASAADGPDDEAAAALVAVAEDGFARGGAASAARAFERAADLTADPVDRARRLASGLRCWLAVGDMASVARVTETLVATAPAEADIDDAVAVGLRWTGGEHRVIAALEEALTRAQGDRRRAVSALLADAHAATGERGEALARATEALADAPDPPDAPAGLASAVIALVGPDGPELDRTGSGGPSADRDPGDGDIDAGIAAAFEPTGDDVEPNSVLGARARLRRAEALTSVGRHAEARTTLRRPHSPTGWDPGEEDAVHARALVMAGEIGAAFERLNRRLDQLPTGADLARAVLLAGLAEAEVLMGRLESAEEHLRIALPRLQAAGAFADVLRGRRTSARLAMAGGDADRAVSELLMGVSRAPGYLSVELTSALMALDRGAEAERLVPSSGGPGAGPLHEIRAGTVAGLVANDDDRLREAAESADRYRLPLEAAEIQLHRAEAAHRAGRPNDIGVLAAEAASRLTALGVGGWAPRLQRLVDAPRNEARRRVADRLTEAEHRVAVTVAAGRTNKEAAAELFLSQKTIDYHLQNIYRKLEIRGRTELAMLLAQGE